MAFVDISEQFPDVVLWLPCDEGQDSIVNQAGDKQKSLFISGTAWDAYDPVTRPAVAMDTTKGDVDLINSTPYSNYGNSVVPSDYPGAFTMYLARYSGALTVALFEPSTDPSAHSFGKAGAVFNFSAGDSSFYSTPHSTDDRIIGVACMTIAGDPSNNDRTKAFFRNVWCFVEYDPVTLQVISEVSADELEENPDGPDRGYGADGGYTFDNMDILVVGGTWELYAAMHHRLPLNRMVSGASTAEGLLSNAKQTFSKWLVGQKDIPAEFYSQTETSNVNNTLRNTEIVTR